MIKNIALRILVLTACFYWSGTASTNAQGVRANNSFDGFYLGVNGGFQNLFGGSFVDGVDVLAQESRFVLEFPIGFRKQFFKKRMVVGPEFQFGFTDGALAHSEPAKPLEIRYKNRTQWGLGLALGLAFGKQKDWLAFAYANETKRKFDVTITDKSGPYKQMDEQGMLKYGIGLEARLFRNLNARATFGGLRVDFGDLTTNIAVDDKPDFTLGAVWQF
jgi:hypothetical protein